MATRMIDHTLYINAQYGNQASLDTKLDDELHAFGKITWRELLTDVLWVKLDVADLAEMLEEEYGLTPDDLDTQLSPADVDNYYDKLAYHTDNRDGAEADAFEFIEDLELFEMDEEGNGGAHGVELVRTTANGPKKYVFVSGPSAAQWLRRQFKKQGLRVRVEFVS